MQLNLRLYLLMRSRFHAALRCIYICISVETTSISLSKTSTSSPRSIKVRAVANPCRPPPIITICLSYNLKWSGQQDLNLRPPAPKAGALPGCAMPRLNLNYTFYNFQSAQKTQPKLGFLI